MIITTGNVLARVDGPDIELDWLSDYLSFDDSSLRFRQGYRGDGKIRMFNRLGSSMPAGFVGMVGEAATAEGFQVSVIDKRVPPVKLDAGADVAWLRDYQLDAVRAVERDTRGILHIATGGGKTECFAALTRRIPCNWLFLVHRNTLVDQAAERVELRTGVSVGRIAEGKWASWDDYTVICASFQSVFAALKKGNKSWMPSQAVDRLLAGAQGVCIDESHVLPADSYLKVINQTKNAHWRVGLSGTPLARGDRRSVLAIGALGRVIYRLRADALVEAGVLAKPKIRMIPVRQTATAPTYQGVYGELVVRSTARNRAVVAACKAAEKPCMVFVKELKHGDKLEEMLGRAGLSASFVSGQHSTDWRKSHVKRLEQGHFDVLIASVVFQEGVDIPDLRSVVIACGGKSVIAALQRIGRGMRLAPGKSTFEVWDIDDTGCEMIQKHSRARIRAYLNEKFEVVMESGMAGLTP